MKRIICDKHGDLGLPVLSDTFKYTCKFCNRELSKAKIKLMKAQACVYHANNEFEDMKFNVEGRLRVV